MLDTASALDTFPWPRAGAMGGAPWPRSREAGAWRLQADPRESGYGEKNHRLVSAVLDGAVALGRCRGRPQSARFVNFYRANLDPDSVATVSARWLFSLPATFTQGAGPNLARFERQILEAADRLQPGQSMRITDVWHARVDGRTYPQETDHCTALASFTVQSSARIVVARADDGAIDLGGSSVEHQLRDRYDWCNAMAICEWEAAGRRVELSARNFQDYERAGGARPFFVCSEPAVSMPACRRDGRITWTTTDACGHVLTLRQPVGPGR